MSSKNKILSICLSSLDDKGLINYPKYLKRLQDEITEAEFTDEFDYYLSLYKKKKASYNEHNSIVMWLLGVVDDFDIDKDHSWVMGEFPDIDVDYQDSVRLYLKNEWAPKRFGEKNVCNIGTYTTYGIKSALKDMARIFDLDRMECEIITKQIDLKDEDGNTITWDSALRISEPFKEYCEKYPEATNAAKRLVNRIRGNGVHAGGLIISKVPLDGLVPLVTDKEGNVVSAFIEGLSGTDLSPLGLVKFDLLSIKISQITQCCKLVAERYGKEKMCALEGGNNWSDLSYLNDPKALALANEARLKGIFQFDSPGIRELVKSGGVTSFDDIPTYSALYRPGCLNQGMHTAYVNRKKGLEEYEVPAVLEKVLGSTYNVLVYQEQIMKMLNIVGNVPPRNCEIIRKAISKKKVEIFGKYKDDFIKNGQEVLGKPKEDLESLWSLVESFAEYGFNKSMTKETLIKTPDSDKEIQDFKAGDIVYCVNKNGETVETKVVALHDHGELEGFEVTFDDGYQVTCSANHKFLTEKGQVSLREICRTRSYIFCDQNIWSDYAKSEERGVENILWNGVAKQKTVSRSSNELQCMQTEEGSREAGEIETYCSLRDKSFDKDRPCRTSSKMRSVQEAGLGWSDTQSTMWDEIQNLEGSGISFPGVQSMQEVEREKYSKTNGKTQQGQRTSRSQKDIFRNRTQNFSTTRDSSSTCCKIKEMARRKSRKICKMYRSSLEKSKTIQNGNLVEKKVNLGFRADSLWRKSKTSRFCQQQYLDRSRWLLPFFRTSKQQSRKFETSESPTTRRNAEKRVFAEKSHNVATHRYDMFSQFNRSDETGMVGCISGHAPITNTRDLLSRKIIRVRSVGKRQMYDLEVSNPTHNFILENGIVTSNSHSYCYGYISARGLYLKAHYPLEFFCSLLQSESDSDKIKFYKQDAETFGIEVLPLDLNKSKENFSIGEDNKIYIGFSNIKGIGLESAKRIVENQPYDGIQDFLDKNGTDANSLKPLIGLRSFPGDPDDINEYVELYRDIYKKRNDRDKRFEKGLDKNLNICKMILKNDDIPDSFLDDVIISLIRGIDYKDFNDVFEFHYVSIQNDFKNKGFTLDLDVGDMKLFMSTIKKMIRSLNGNLKKKQADEPFRFDTFKPTGASDVYKNKLKCEREFYGFEWKSQIELSPGYKPNLTFNNLIADNSNAVVSVQVKVVKKIQKKISKNGKTTFYVLAVEDSIGQLEEVQFWDNDYQKFKEELDYWSEEDECGNLLSLKLVKPTPPFSRFLFYSPPRWERHKLSKDKNEDNRLFVLKLDDKGSDV